MIYQIEITDDAKTDMSFFEMYERKIILAGIKEQLTHEPLKETKNRKKLRDNPIAAWELRIGRYRIFYEVNKHIAGSNGFCGHRRQPPIEPATSRFWSQFS